MIGLDRIRQQGFKLRLAENGLYIDPIDDLTEGQRQWIIRNKPAVRQKLLTERWQWFMSLATEHGIHTDVIGAEFPTKSDKLDVVEPTEHDDDTLRLCMATLCRDARVIQRQEDYQAGRWLPVTKMDAA